LREIEFLKCNGLEDLHIFQTVKLQRRRTAESLRVLFPDDPFFSHINKAKIEKETPLIHALYFMYFLRGK
jgi:hypothetical protein